MRPILVVLALVALPALLAIGWVATHAPQVRDRVLSLFRRPVTGTRAVGPGHYYRQYWKRA